MLLHHAHRALPSCRPSALERAACSAAGLLSNVSGTVAEHIAIQSDISVRPNESH